MLEISVASLHGESYRATASFVVLPGSAGELGILPGHQPLLTTLGAGYVRVEREDQQVDLLFVSGGMAEVSHQVVTVLADTAFRSDSSDHAAATRARQLTQEAIAAGWTGLDLDQAERMLQQSLLGLRLPGGGQHW